MKRLFVSIIFLVSVLAAGTAFAAQKTVKLAVENMYCASCPYIVQQSLINVPGVSDVRVSFAQKTAMVTFDDSETNVGVLTEATSASGYPSRLAGNLSASSSTPVKEAKSWWSKLGIFN